MAQILIPRTALERKRRAGSSTQDFEQLRAAEQRRRARRLKNLDLVAAGKRSFPSPGRSTSKIVIATLSDLSRIVAGR